MEKQIQHMAIMAAYWQNEWCPGTDWSEVLESDPGFEQIIKQAEQNLTLMGYPQTLTEKMIVDTMYSYLEGYEEYDLLLTTLEEAA